MKVHHGEARELVTDGKERFESALTAFRNTYHREPTVFASAPGRCEIIGNHTDHNDGRVVAAAIDLDALIVAAPSQDGHSRLTSRGWETRFCINPQENRSSDQNDTERLMRGIGDGLVRSGHEAPPFDAVLDSRVLPGSGLSSSAALEMSLIGIHQALGSYHLSHVQRARIGQYAENEHIGKPCGLMDQMASSVGGSVAIDFSDAADVKYNEIGLDFRQFHYQLAVIDTGGNHADLTAHYAAIPTEMKALAAHLGGETLSRASKGQLLSSLPALRRSVGDRAVLRGIHFFDEQARVAALVKAAEDRHLEALLSRMTESGLSSWTLLQNIYPPESEIDQSMAIGLTLTREFLSGKGANGAYRVHGGGFAGTILAVVPEDLFPEYRAMMNGVFGDGATQPLRISTHGLIFGHL